MLLTPDPKIRSEGRISPVRKFTYVVPCPSSAGYLHLLPAAIMPKVRDTHRLLVCLHVELLNRRSAVK